ncbi:MAG: DUF4920 domain-containing protein [Sphingobacteriales bacterium]|nr:MAG: DUF4920 domain-containing protein [Sphingobacteriales bacterium]
MLQVRNFLCVIFLMLLVSACDFSNNNLPKENKPGRTEDMETRKVGFYGKKIDENGAISGRELKDKLGSNTTMQAKIKGEIVEVAADDSDWLQVDMEDGTTMQINMKDHSFSIPKDITGRTVIAEGTVRKDSIPVVDLHDYAEEVGKTEEEVRTILELDPKLKFTAEGVIIK